MANNYTNQSSTNQLSEEIKRYLEEHVKSVLNAIELSEDQERKVAGLAANFAIRACNFIDEKVSLTYMKNKLDLLFEYEKHYLSLIKEYKEEIKFASSLQEDLRKERANFFSATLREVYATLQATKVGPEMESLWLERLVSSYTESLDLSAELAKENTLSRVSELKEESKDTKEEIENQ